MPQGMGLMNFGGIEWGLLPELAAEQLIRYGGWVIDSREFLLPSLLFVLCVGFFLAKVLLRRYQSQVNKLRVQLRNAENLLSNKIK
jgi:hypothetical protein